MEETRTTIHSELVRCNNFLRENPIRCRFVATRRASAPNRLRKYPKQSRAAFLPKGKPELFFPPSGN
jgi:hypothetical protein